MSKIIDEIMDYVKSKNTDYAIMVDGKWGSGKTYFWTKELKPTIESTYYDQYNMYSTIYVSLYGLTSIEEINKKVFFELTQKMDKNINRYMQNRRTCPNTVIFFHVIKFLKKHVFDFNSCKLRSSFT